MSVQSLSSYESGISIYLFDQKKSPRKIKNIIKSSTLCVQRYIQNTRKISFFSQYTLLLKKKNQEEKSDIPTSVIQSHTPSKRMKCFESSEMVSIFDVQEG